MGRAWKGLITNNVIPSSLLLGPLCESWALLPCGMLFNLSLLEVPEDFPLMVVELPQKPD